MSCDGGTSWAHADLEPAYSKWSWRLWSFALCAAPGALHVTVRAWDSTGSTQPEFAATLWNPKGYANKPWATATFNVT